MSARAVMRKLTAVVVSSGHMDKTVKARLGTQQWDKHIRKLYGRKHQVLVHDPANSLRDGDVITVQPGWRTSKHVHHVVSEVIAPFGVPLEERPPVPTEEERIAERERRTVAKKERKAKGGIDELVRKEGERLASEVEADNVAQTEGTVNEGMERKTV